MLRKFFIFIPVKRCFWPDRSNLYSSWQENTFGTARLELGRVLLRINERSRQWGRSFFWRSSSCSNQLHCHCSASSTNHTLGFWHSPDTARRGARFTTTASAEPATWLFREQRNSQLEFLYSLGRWAVIIFLTKVCDKIFRKRTRPRIDKSAGYL